MQADVTLTDKVQYTYRFSNAEGSTALALLRRDEEFLGKLTAAFTKNVKAKLGFTELNFTVDWSFLINGDEASGNLTLCKAAAMPKFELRARPTPSLDELRRSNDHEYRNWKAQRNATELIQQEDTKQRNKAATQDIKRFTQVAAPPASASPEILEFIRDVLQRQEEKHKEAITSLTDRLQRIELKWGSTIEAHDKAIAERDAQIKEQQRLTKELSKELKQVRAQLDTFMQDQP